MNRNDLIKNIGRANNVYLSICIYFTQHICMPLLILLFVPADAAAAAAALNGQPFSCNGLI